MSWIERARKSLDDKLREQMARESANLDAYLSDLLWRGQIEELPRIVRAPLVNLGTSLVLPGQMMPDGKARLIVNPLQHVNEPAVIEQLDSGELA